MYSYIIYSIFGFSLVYIFIFVKARKCHECYQKIALHIVVVATRNFTISNRSKRNMNYINVHSQISTKVSRQSCQNGSYLLRVRAVLDEVGVIGVVSPLALRDAKLASVERADTLGLLAHVVLWEVPGAVVALGNDC